MKLRIATLLLMACLVNASCIKSLLDKKDDTNNNPDDPNKYTGLWRATQTAVDLNSNNVIDANEKGPVNGSSELNMDNNSGFTFSLRPANGNSVTLSGTWKLSADKKNITVTDNTQGSLRFDIIGDKEIHTEPLISNGQTAWLIYSR
jgi:hypothetical protein